MPERYAMYIVNTDWFRFLQTSFQGFLKLKEMLRHNSTARTANTLSQKTPEPDYVFLLPAMAVAPTLKTFYLIDKYIIAARHSANQGITPCSCRHAGSPGRFAW